MFNTDKINNLTKRSAKALNIFTKTVNELKEINSEANSEITIRDEEIERLKAEREQLSVTIDGNNKTIEKIQKIFE